MSPVERLEESIPKVEDGAIVPVADARILGMVDGMHLRRNDHGSEGPLEARRQCNIAVLKKLRDAQGHAIDGEDGLGNAQEKTNALQGSENGTHLDDVMADAGRAVEGAVAVVHLVEAPKNRDGMEETVKEVAREIQH
jgi:hypothetical protein